MSKTFTLLALGLFALCGLCLWVGLRRYAARRRLEQERAIAFMAQAVKSLNARKEGTG